VSKTSEQNLSPIVEYAIYFVCLFAIGCLFQKASSGIFFGLYPYAGASLIVVLVSAILAWNASQDWQKALRLFLPVVLLFLLVARGGLGQGFVVSMQQKIGAAHFLFLFLSSVFSFIFTNQEKPKKLNKIPKEVKPISISPAASSSEDAFDRLVGQEHVVKPLKEIAKVVKSGIRVGKKNAPHSVLLFLGPTGVGKTEAARALALAVFGSEDALIRFDMGQFTDAHQASRFYGPPPGYVGYEEGGQLTRAVQKRPRAVVLLDEVEKAHSQIWDAFLPVFDEGYIVDGSSNQKIDMTNTIIVLTSNLLANVAGVESLSSLEVKNRLQETKHFRPELVGRINEILVFNSLDAQTIAQILRLRIDQALWSLSDQGVSVEIGEDEITQLVQQVNSAQFGVRQIDDVVRQYLRAKITE
jgi:AAA domain (Cdc48 subfamily)/C-terminal, D2-small domain, of ClpB protein